MVKVRRLKRGVTFRGKVVVREKQGNRYVHEPLLHESLMCDMTVHYISHPRSHDHHNLLIILFFFPAGSNVSHTPADRKCFVVYDSHGRYRFFFIYNSFLQ